MNIINLSDKDLDKNIYRYLDFYRVIQIFKNNEMTFVLPKLWDDPFENYILNPDIRDSNGFRKRITYNSHIFGQCWTLKSASDAMWRLYSPHKMSVRIRTTPRLLKDAIDNGIENNKTTFSYIGKVNYLSSKKILGEAESLVKKIWSSSDNRAAIDTLLLKRLSFSHENEIRVLILENKEFQRDEILKIKINPHKLIKGVLIDSRAPEEIYDLYKTYLRQNLKFKGPIGKSSLYKKQNKLQVKIDN